MAAAKVVGLLTAHAEVMRAHAGRGFVEITPFDLPVLTVVALAGLIVGEPTAYAVGLTSQGPAELRTVRAPGATFTPASARADLGLMLLTGEPSTSLETVVDSCGEQIRGAAIANPALVSLDWDHVVVSAAAAKLRIVAHTSEPTPFGRC